MVRSALLGASRTISGARLIVRDAANWPLLTNEAG
jgi:hypothetical protein